jgi:hypothetical protein
LNNFRHGALTYRTGPCRPTFTRWRSAEARKAAQRKGALHRALSMDTGRADVGLRKF